MMVPVNYEVLRRVRVQNSRSRCDNRCLHETLKTLRDNPYAHCRDVLCSMTEFCRQYYDIESGPSAHNKQCVCHDESEEDQTTDEGNRSSNANGKTSSKGKGKRRCSPSKYQGEGATMSKDAKGPGATASSCLCGGYTPGGANRLRALKAKTQCCENSGCPTAEDFNTGMRHEGGTKSSGGERDCPEYDSQPEGNRPSARILGEMSFQLERRILDYVFGITSSKRGRFYGYTVSNICYMMEKESTHPGGQNDVIGRTEMTCRLRKMLCALEKYGYDIKVHADFAQQMVNKYGLLPSQPDMASTQLFGLNDAGAMSCLISRLCKRQSEVHNLNILLNCLAFLSNCDGRPLFVW